MSRVLLQLAVIGLVGLGIATAVTLDVPQAAATSSPVITAADETRNPMLDADPWRRDSVYMTTVRGNVDGLEDTSDAKLFATARGVCRMVDEVPPPVPLVTYVRGELHVDATDAAFIVGVALHAQCPEVGARATQAPKVGG